MTYKEKLQKEHPEAIGNMYYGGCARCPCEWGYEKEQHCDGKKITWIKCQKCWERKIK